MGGSLEPLVWRAILGLASPRTVKASVVLLLLLAVASLAPLFAADSIRGSQLGKVLEDQLGNIKKTGQESYRELPLAIYLNNVKVSALVAILYPTIIIPIIIIIINGMVLGFLPVVIDFRSSLSSLGVNLSPGDAGLLYYAGLVPHGMLELTTIMLVASLVAYGPSLSLRRIAERIASRLLVAGVNLLVAALVETVVTPVVMIAVLVAVG